MAPTEAKVDVHLSVAEREMLQQAVDLRSKLKEIREAVAQQCGPCAYAEVVCKQNCVLRAVRELVMP